MQIQGPSNNQIQSKHEMFGNIALDAFRSAIHDDDFEPLSAIFPPHQIMMIRQKLGAVPSMADLEHNARHIMNMFHRRFNGMD